MGTKLKVSKHSLKTISFIALLVAAIIFISFFLMSQTGEKVADDGDYFDNLISADNSLAEKNKRENSGLADNAVNNIPGEIPPISEDDNYTGELSAPVKIIVYDDFAAPFSSEFALVVNRALEEYSGQVVAAYRYFPSDTDALSLLAALAAECAAEQGKFWEMHDRLFQANTGKELGAGNFNAYADSLGLNTDDFNSCFESAKYRDKILNQAETAKSASVAGTPTFYVNGNIYIGAYHYEDFTRSDGSGEKGLKSIIEDIVSVENEE